LLQELPENEKLPCGACSPIWWYIFVVSYKNMYKPKDANHASSNAHKAYHVCPFLMENLEHFLELEKTFKPQAQIDFFTNFKIAYKQLVSTIGSIDA
jgi:hypothetical protein